MGWLKFGSNVAIRGQLDVGVHSGTPGGLNVRRGGISVDAGNTDLTGGTAILDSGTAAPDHDALSGAISVHRIGGAGGSSRLYFNPGDGTTYFIDHDGVA